MKLVDRSRPRLIERVHTVCILSPYKLWVEATAEILPGLEIEGIVVPEKTSKKTGPEECLCILKN